MKSAIDLLCTAQTDQAAILGDMLELGDNENMLHAQIGRYAVEKGVRTLLCIGTRSRYMYEEALKTVEETGKQGVLIAYYATVDELLSVIEGLLPKGVTVLVKASNAMHFGTIIQYYKEYKGE